MPSHRRSMPRFDRCIWQALLDASAVDDDSSNDELTLSLADWSDGSTAACCMRVYAPEGWLGYREVLTLWRTLQMADNTNIALDLRLWEEICETVGGADGMHRAQLEMWMQDWSVDRRNRLQKMTMYAAAIRTLWESSTCTQSMIST